MTRPKLTPRLQHEAARWRNAPRPDKIVTPGPGQESVWDYPRPPRLDLVTRPIRIEHADCVIAETTRALRIAETASPPCYYVPPEDVELRYLQMAPGRSYCEWKGWTRYWNLRVNHSFVDQAAWSYPEPFEEYAELRDYIGFYAQKLDRCTVDGAVVEPQPGGFYGGWVTPDLVGPFKGIPGSQGW